MKLKNKIKLFDKAIELVKQLIELQKVKAIPIPDYKKGYNDEFIKQNEVGTYKRNLDGNLTLVKKESFDSKKESVILPNGEKIILQGGRTFGKTNFYEEWSKLINQHLKDKGLNNSQPFAHPIENKELKIDYNVIFGEIKTPIEPPLGFNHDFHKGMIEAEKELQNVCKIKSIEMPYFRFKCVKCEHRSKYVDIDLKEKTTQCENCYTDFSVEIINNKIIITEIN